MTLQILQSFTFFSDLNHFILLGMLSLVLSYGAYFYFTHGFKSRSQIVVFVLSFVLLAYIFVTKHFTYHFITFLLLLLMSFILYFKNESRAFLTYMFFQVSLVFFSYICMLLSILILNENSALYTLIDTSSVTLTYDSGVAWQKLLQQVAFAILIAFTFTFKKLDEIEYWFEKATIYYIGITKVPLLLLIALFANNYSFITDLLIQIRPVLFVVLLGSMITIAYTKKMSRILCSINNMNIAMFWIVASVIENFQVNHLFQLVLFQIFVLFVFIVFYYNRSNFLLKNDSGDSKIVIYDIIFSPKAYIGDNGALFWMILLPGSFGYYIFAYSATKISQVSTLFISLFIIVYLWVVLRNTVKMIRVFYLSRKEKITDNWLNKPVYPLVAINIIILLSELIWKRVLLN